MSLLHKLWVEKYRPTEIEDYLFQNKAQKSKFLKMIVDQSLPHLILSGVQGTGKTSLAHLLFKQIGVDEDDILIIDASKDTSVEFVRNEIDTFIKQFPTGDFRVVLMEEADQFSHAGQKALKVTLEEYADVVRFVFTTNHEQKILPAIKSRCQQFRFKAHNVPQVTNLCMNILEKEGMLYDPDDVDKYIALCYPDIRKTIQMLQENSVGKKLMPASDSTSENSDYKYKMLEMIEADQWDQLRSEVLPSIATEEWDDAYRFLYENIHRSPKMQEDVANMKQAVVAIAEYLYRHSFFADPIINASALMVRISEI
jgi:DNA polymerase III delta prime subunit